MAKKKSAQPISPFYRAVFHVNKTAMGYQQMDDDWGRATGFVMARHRCREDHTPYCIPNEYISARLGTALGLPIPPFALTKVSDHGQRLMFSSLDFNPASVRLPPIEPDICMKRLATVCVGIIVFDIWIANEDRHEENLAVDKLMAPKKIRVFDHDQAIFGGLKEIGVPRLDKLRDRLGITGSAITGGTPHCLLPFLHSADHLDHWIERVQSIPEWFVVESCKAMQRISLTKKEVDAAIAFLLHRQKTMHELAKRKLCEHCKITLPPRETQGTLPFAESKP
jgi:hypothetical protein